MGSLIRKKSTKNSSTTMKLFALITIAGIAIAAPRYEAEKQAIQAAKQANRSAKEAAAAARQEEKEDNRADWQAHRDSQNGSKAAAAAAKQAARQAKEAAAAARQEAKEQK